MDLGAQLAKRCNVPEVWSQLARAHLSRDNVKEAIAFYVRANDPSQREVVILKAKENGERIKIPNPTHHDERRIGNIPLQTRHYDYKATTTSIL